MSDIARLIPDAPLRPFETYFHFFFLRTYRFKQRSGERNILPHFYFSTPEEQSCIVESCITERLPQERFIILENISQTLMKVVVFFYFFPRALLFFLKNFAAIAVIGSSLSRIISLFHKGEYKKRRNIMPQLQTPVHHCFQSFRVLDDKKKRTHNIFLRY